MGPLGEAQLERIAARVRGEGLRVEVYGAS
jgi:hypothetical protein